MFVNSTLLLIIIVRAVYVLYAFVVLLVHLLCLRFYCLYRAHKSSSLYWPKAANTKSNLRQ